MDRNLSRRIASKLLSKQGLLSLAAVFLLREIRKQLRRRSALAAGIHPSMNMTPLEDSMAEAKAFPPAVGASQINNILNAFVWYETAPTEAQVLASAERLLGLKRFRAVPVDGGWKLQETKAADHVTMRTAPTEDLALVTLQALAQTKELPQDRPLWSIDVVAVEKGCSLGLVRVHHVLGDGIGLFSEMFPRLATKLDGSPLDLVVPELPKWKGSFVQSLLWYLDSARSALRVVGSAAVSAESDLPFLDPDRMALTYSGRREMLIFPTLSLEYVKRVKDAARESIKGCTINDVVYAGWAGAMRQYSEARGYSFGQQPSVARSLLAVAVPRSFPEGHDPEDRLTNNFAFVPVDLDLNAAAPQDRLRKNKANLDIVKKTTIALVSLWITKNIQPLLPTFLQQQTARDIFARHSLVFSNVPGPKEEVLVLGQHALKFHCAFFNLNTQVLAISVCDKIFMNVTADPEVSKGMESQFPEYFIKELETLGRSYGVEGSCLYDN